MTRKKQQSTKKSRPINSPTTVQTTPSPTLPLADEGLAAASSAAVGTTVVSANDFINVPSFAGRSTDDAFAFVKSFERYVEWKNVTTDDRKRALRCVRLHRCLVRHDRCVRRSFIRHTTAYYRHSIDGISRPTPYNTKGHVTCSQRSKPMPNPSTTSRPRFVATPWKLVPATTPSNGFCCVAWNQAVVTQQKASTVDEIIEIAGDICTEVECVSGWIIRHPRTEPQDQGEDENMTSEAKVEANDLYQTPRTLKCVLADPRGQGHEGEDSAITASHNNCYGACCRDNPAPLRITSLQVTTLGYLKHA